MRVIHEVGKYVAVEKDGVERLRYNYQLPDDPAPSAPKPFCHPIRTPSGIEMTALSPLDHFWHRGVWFTWKFVNGVNYWEENQEVVGRQVTLAPPDVIATTGAPGETILCLSQLEWRDARDGAEAARLSEQRAIFFTFAAGGEVVMDWHIEQTALEDVTLDRTPFTTWGGYGGVVARMTQGLHKQRIVFDDGTETNRPTGQPYRWGGIEGTLDTGRGNEAAFVFLPSPDNRRHPEPFYGNARDWSNFFGPAPLFHEPLSLAKGETLRHAVRVLALPRRVNADEVEGYYAQWSEASEAG